MDSHDEFITEMIGLRPTNERLRDGINLKQRLSLAGHKPRISPVLVFIHILQVASLGIW